MYVYREVADLLVTENPSAAARLVAYKKKKKGIPQQASSTVNYDDVKLDLTKPNSAPLRSNTGL